MGLTPNAHGNHDRLQRLAHGRQGIFYFGRNFAVNFSPNNSVALKFAQLLGKHFYAGLWNETGKLAGATGTFEKVMKNDWLPFAANYFQSPGDGAFSIFHKIQFSLFSQYNTKWWILAN
jgi:hypothetical protein